MEQTNSKNGTHELIKESVNTRGWQHEQEIETSDVPKQTKSHGPIIKFLSAIINLEFDLFENE